MSEANTTCGEKIGTGAPKGAGISNFNRQGDWTR